MLRFSKVSSQRQSRLRPLPATRFLELSTFWCWSCTPWSPPLPRGDSVQVSRNHSDCRSWSQRALCIFHTKSWDFNRETLLIPQPRKALRTRLRGLGSSLAVRTDWAARLELKFASSSGRVLFGFGWNARACRDSHLLTSPMITRIFQLCLPIAPPCSSPRHRQHWEGLVYSFLRSLRKEVAGDGDM